MITDQILSTSLVLFTSLPHLLVSNGVTFFGIVRSRLPNPSCYTKWRDPLIYESPRSQTFAFLFLFFFSQEVNFVTYLMRRSTPHSPPCFDPSYLCVKLRIDHLVLTCSVNVVNLSDRSSQFMVEFGFLSFPNLEVPLPPTQPAFYASYYVAFRSNRDNGYFVFPKIFLRPKLFFTHIFSAPSLESIILSFEQAYLLPILILFAPPTEPILNLEPRFFNFHFDPLFFPKLYN